MATDSLWDAAGDLAVGSGSNTAGRLAIGAAGSHLSVVNSGVAWDSGTSFPADKATGDRYWRSDLAMEFYWDGTRWLSTTLYVQPILRDPSEASQAAANALGIGVDWAGDFDQYILNFVCTTFVSTTNDGSKYWTVTLQKAIADGTATAITSFTTASDTASKWYRHKVAVNALLGNGTTYPSISCTIVKTSTPGGLYWAPSITYRLVGV